MFKIEDLFAVGMHYGHKIRRSSPKMKPYVFDVRWDICVIDLCKTAKLLEKALDELKTVVSKNGKILFVGTKYQAKDLVAQAAKECNEYYIDKRWLGGSITNNYSTIGVISAKLSKMEREEESGYIAKFSKKEKGKFYQKKQKFVELLSGVRNLYGTPDMLIVVDPKKEKIAVLEAKKANIPVIALCDTDFDEPSLIKHLIPGNDEGTSSIKFFLDQCVKVINESKKVQAPIAAVVENKEEKQWEN